MVQKTVSPEVNWKKCAKWIENTENYVYSAVTPMCIGATPIAPRRETMIFRTKWWLVPENSARFMQLRICWSCYFFSSLMKYAKLDVISSGNATWYYKHLYKSIFLHFTYGIAKIWCQPLRLSTCMQCNGTTNKKSSNHTTNFYTYYHVRHRCAMSFLSKNWPSMYTELANICASCPVHIHTHSTVWWEYEMYLVCPRNLLWSFQPRIICFWMIFAVHSDCMPQSRSAQVYGNHRISTWIILTRVVVCHYLLEV